LYKIVKKEKLAEDIDRFYLKAPLIARKVKAGQFVVIRINEDGERIPLTIAGYNRSNGIINIVSMRVGKTTSLLSSLKEGNNILDVVGPLGNASEIENFGRVICVGGGVGVAPIFPIARELKKIGNYVISIIGARSKDLLILKDKRITRIIAIGPALMMASVAEVTKPFNIKTIVSLNSIMVDGTGMCGACRVEVGGKTKFVCVNGPEFDAHQVNFDLLLSRQKTYCDHEKECMDLYKHKCKLPE